MLIIPAPFNQSALQRWTTVTGNVLENKLVFVSSTSRTKVVSAIRPARFGKRDLQNSLLGCADTAEAASRSLSQSGGGLGLKQIRVVNKTNTNVLRLFPEQQ